MHKDLLIITFLRQQCLIEIYSGHIQIQDTFFLINDIHFLHFAIFLLLPSFLVRSCNTINCLQSMISTI